MRDVGVVRIAGPRDIFFAVGQRIADRVQAFDEKSFGPEHVEDASADARHDAHVDHHVGRVGDLHADARDFRADRAHAEGDDIHGAPAHAAAVKPAQLFLHGRRVFPVVGRTRVVLQLAADEGALLHAGHVAGIGADEQGVWSLFFVQADGRSGLDHELAQAPILFLRAVAPDHAVRLAQIPDFFDPLQKSGVFGRSVGHS